MYNDVNGTVVNKNPKSGNVSISPNNVNFQLQSNSYNWEGGYGFLEKFNFVESLGCTVEAYTALVYTGVRFDAIDDIASVSGLKYSYKMESTDYVNIKFFDDGKQIMLARLYGISILPLEKSATKTMSIDVVGPKEYVLKYLNAVKNKFPVESVCNVNWAFQTTSGIKHKTFTLENKYPVKNEYYPCIKEDIYEYFDRYMKDDSAVLVLLGDPGTGKTTFIRNLITRGKMNVSVTYDRQVMESDEYYMDFLDGNTDVMIFEDAESLLLPREAENKIMSRLLNTSDGIISLPKKKIIFTANITNVNNIDSALLRSGRCFDVVNFRNLTREEAEKVAEVENIKLQDDRSEYSLADIFSTRKNDNKFKKKFGF